VTYVMYLFDQIISSCFYHFCCDFVCSWTLIHWHALHSFLHLFKKYIFIFIISWWRAYLFQLFYSLLVYDVLVCVQLTAKLRPSLFNFFFVYQNLYIFILHCGCLVLALLVICFDNFIYFFIFSF